MTKAKKRSNWSGSSESLSDSSSNGPAPSLTAASSRRRESAAGIDPAVIFNPPIERKPEIKITKENVTLLVDENKNKKWANAAIRTLWTFVMIAAMLGILLAGHAWVVLLVVVLQTLVYKEVISIGVSPAKEKRLPWNRFAHWYFLFTTNYFLYGETLIERFKPYVFVDAFLMPLAQHHRFISFCLYCLGIVLFVINLKKGHYKFQFSQFGWTHMVLLIVVCQSHFIINNIFEGLIWFLLPACLVICNDIAAYVFGFFFGRTPLIALSPKKTWEGFLGALFSTVVFGWFFSAFLSRYPYMYCPMRDFSTSSLSDYQCTPNAVFLPRDYRLPPMLSGLLRFVLPFAGFPFRTVTIYPMQLHSLTLSLFASVVAPFGGFFASGFKRAFNIKDFGDSIPGHGGITDRMDCQFMMGLFSYMYFRSFVGVYGGVDVGSIVETAVSGLNEKELIELVGRLREYLDGQGIEI
ncbi:phosphatidate cytidylyltransferase [Powellomyces hirtus]|uniref:Phosphatidate cytidylyltransferase n=1 Tax=Powellomyces hirtus TaxID=109895 RepID=A0A507E939_9FUNG|nr:phosphatidate cytidylyltransferase [Powellomyces hirtus]